MGLGFEATSSPWKRRLWASPSVPAMVKEVRRIYSEQLGDPLLVSLLHLEVDGPSVVARWHPAEEGLRFTLLEDGRLHAAAATSLLGPGYHAFLLSLLDRVASDLKVTWDFEHGDGDETGFATTRDQAALELAMLDWLRAVCRNVLEMDAEGVTDIGLSMSIDSPRPKHDAIAYSATGVWQRERFARAIESDEELRLLGEDFFAWWSPGLEASFWLGLGSVILWCDFAWVSPRDEAERALAALAVACLERAQAKAPAMVPKEVLGEARSLMAAAEPIESPRGVGIGHRRRICTFRLLGRWTLELPGHFNKQVLEEGNNLQFDDGKRAVYVSALSVDGAPSAQSLLTSARNGEPADLSWSAGNVWGEARWRVEDGCQHLMAECAVEGRILLLTVTDEIGAKREWAEEVAQSARHRDE